MSENEAINKDCENEDRWIIVGRDDVSMCPDDEVLLPPNLEQNDKAENWAGGKTAAASSHHLSSFKWASIVIDRNILAPCCPPPSAPSPPTRTVSTRGQVFIRKQDHTVYQMRPNVGPRFSVSPKWPAARVQKAKVPKVWPILWLLLPSHFQRSCRSKN